MGKTAFLDAISQTLGTVVENESSSELHIKVGIKKITAYRQHTMWMMRTSTRSYTSICQGKKDITSMSTSMSMVPLPSFSYLTSRERDIRAY